MKKIIVGSFLAIILVVLFMKKKLIKDTVKNVMGFTRASFVETFGPMAVKAAKGTGLFPSVFIAQAILESADGNSSLSKNAKNYFGIKADKSWTGNFVIKKTTEYVDGKPISVQAKFRAYETPLASFADRAEFLIKNARYKKAGVFSALTPEMQAVALQRGGYATDPAYAELLIKLINQNNLKKYDT